MEEPPDPKVRLRQERKRLKLTRGKLIRRARELFGLSQPELGALVGATVLTVSRWEREVGQEPNLFHQRHLAELFGLEVHDLGYLQEGDEQARQTLWHVPYQRNPFFVGREAALQRLREALMAGKSAVLTHALSGLGGIGKTQLAVEYAYRYQDTYQAVLWAGADSPEILLADLAGIARTLHLRIGKKQDQVMDALRHWLETHTDWLLILDNVENLRILDDILPRGKEGYQGHILLTTRRQAQGSRAKKIPLETMQANEGATLILRRAKKLPEDAALGMATERDQVKAKDISTEMGGLPLALDQAGAYIEETMCSVGEYLELYLTRRAELLARRGADPSGHPLSVSTTLSLSIERVRHVNPAACELLTFCSHLHPDAIPEDLFVAGSPELGPLLMALATDPLQLDKAIRVLSRYSLVLRDAETSTLSLHRLVQAVVQDAMPTDLCRLWAERTVQALHRVCAGASLLDERYLPHLQEGARLIERWGLRDQSAASLLAQTGTALREQGLYAQSQPLCLKAAQMYQQIVGPEEDPAFAQSVLSVALTSARMGHYEAAEFGLEGAWMLYERALGEDHLKLIEPLNEITDFYIVRGRVDLAGACCQQALMIFERHTIHNSPELAHCLHNMGRVYARLRIGDWGREYYQRALTMREQLLGPDHLDTAESLADLAELDAVQGNPESARSLIVRSIAIREQVLGPEHPDTADSLEILGVVYRKRGELSQAEEVHRRVLKIRTRRLGPWHPDVGKAHKFLAAVYRMEGREGDARRHLQSAREIDSQIELFPGEVSFTLAEESIPALRGMGSEHVAARFESIVAFLKEKRNKYGIQPRTRQNRGRHSGSSPE